MSYTHLFKKGQIGSVTLKNRIVMPPMGTNLASPDGGITDRQIRYYEERAKGGTGLIIVEVSSVDYEYGKASVTQPRVDDDRFIPGIHHLAKAVHKHGAKIFMQLHHAGRQSSSSLIGGKQIVAPSPITCAKIGEEPRELTNAEIKELVNKYINGAVRSKMAGVDGVEVHAAHGYLVNEFLSPYTNHRNDEYGGNFENRMRFLKEIIVGIKEKCGKDFPVSVRLSVDEFVEGGIDLKMGREISLYLEKTGVDALHASAGTYDSSGVIVESPLYEQGWKVYLAEEIKKAVKIPVITVGVIREPQFADSILAEGKADFIAIGRGQIADPDWTHKAQEGREKEIRMCISCMHCIYAVGKMLPIQCSTNARAGREIEFDQITPIKEKRHIAVVGGGPGGMETARVLSLKGYDVTLFEKEERLGGQLNLVSKPVHKEKTDWFIDYLRNEMKRLRVNVRLNTEATIERIEAMDPYAIFLLTGAKSYIPTIKGHDAAPTVYTYEDFLSGRKTFNKGKIAVLGSGMICHSVITQLADKGNEVTYIELPTVTGFKISAPVRKRLAKSLEAVGVNVMTAHKPMEIQSNAVRIEDKETGNTLEIETDYVVFAMGTESYNPLEATFRNHFKNIHVLGDAANNSGSLANAIKDGHEQAFLLK